MKTNHKIVIERMKIEINNFNQLTKMKTTKFMTMALLLAATGASMSSCSVSDNEKSPEQVVDPITDAVEYYIVGQVTENGNALSGVTVTTSGVDAVTTDNSGQFVLTVNDLTTYTLTFTKDGYLNASTDVALSGLSNRSSVAVSIQMTKKATEVSIPTGSDVLVQANSAANATKVTTTTSDEASVAGIASVGAFISQEAIAADTKVSMTEYVPEAASTQSGQNVSSAIMAVHIETTSGRIDGSIAPVVLSVKNPANEGTAFQKVTVYKSGKSRAADESLGEAVYDANTNSYNYNVTTTLNGSYEFRVSSTRNASGSATSLIKESKVDNSGNFEAKTNVTIAYGALMGWTYTTEPSDNGLAALVKNAIEAQEGAEGTYTVNYEETTNISGNSIMYWKAENKYSTITYTFPLISGNVKAVLKKYTGAAFTYTNTVANQHSGGTSTTGNAQ